MANRMRKSRTSRAHSAHRYSMRIFITCAAVILLVLPVRAAGQEAGSEGTTYGAIVATVREMNRLLDAALELALSGIGGRLTDDRTAIAQRLLNLLEGPDSALFDPSVDTVEPIGLGLRPLWEEYYSLSLGLDDDTDREAFADSVSLPAIVAMNDLMLFGMGDFLRLASAAAQEAIAIEGETDEAWYARNDAFRAAYAHLSAVRGSIDDPHLVTGFATVANFLPPIEIWITPDESIQAAIDRLPKGGTVHLGPGVYEETLTIEKSVTLAGSGSEETIIQGVEWRSTATVMNDSPLVVTIRDLSLSGGANGIVAVGDSHVSLERVGFEGLRMGVAGGVEARVVCTSCIFENCDTAVNVFDSAQCELREGCRITGCRPEGLAAIWAGNDAHLIVVDSTIERNAANGIFLQGNATLHVTSSIIRSNLGYGIGSCDPWPKPPTEEELNSQGHHGFVSGGGNIIPDEDEENSNLFGAVCPLSLDFLTEPLTED